jgi:hypothetical protein
MQGICNHAALVLLLVACLPDLQTTIPPCQQWPPTAAWQTIRWDMFELLSKAVPLLGSLWMPAAFKHCTWQITGSGSTFCSYARSWMPSAQGT